MATALNTFSGDETGASSSTEYRFRAVAQFQYTDTDESKGVYLQRRYYLEVTKSPVTSVWATATVSWQTAKVSMSSTGTYADTDWVDVGWVGYGETSDQTCTAYYQGGSGTVYTSSVTDTLTIPIPTYTITYNANGGTGAPSSQTKTHNVNLTLSSTKPTRTGYTFAGWSDSASGSKLWDAGGTYMWNKKCTLYALWTEHALTVKYYSNYADYGTYKGEVLEDVVLSKNSLVYTQTYLYSESQTNGFNDIQNSTYLYLSKTGYISTGMWGTSTSGGKTVDEKTSFDTGQAMAEALGLSLKTGNATATVYAQWDVNQLIVNYYSNYATAYGGEYEIDTTVNNNNVYLYTRIYDYDGSYPSGMLNYTNEGDNLYMYRTGYFATGYWGTELDGGNLVYQSTSFDTGQALALALGKDLLSGDATIAVYPQWEPANVAYYNNNGEYVLCNTYGKVDGEWQPMLFYGKINGAWKRSIVDE